MDPTSVIVPQLPKLLGWLVKVAPRFGGWAAEKWRARKARQNPAPFVRVAPGRLQVAINEIDRGEARLYFPVFNGSYDPVEITGVDVSQFYLSNGSVRPQTSTLHAWGVAGPGQVGEGSVLVVLDAADIRSIVRQTGPAPNLHSCPQVPAAMQGGIWVKHPRQTFRLPFAWDLRSVEIRIQSPIVTALVQPPLTPTLPRS